MEVFENWLFHEAPGLDCAMKLNRPGLRPETRELLARAKQQTPMDKIEGFADKYGAEVEFLVGGEPVSSDREPR